MPVLKQTGFSWTPCAWPADVVATGPGTASSTQRPPQYKRLSAVQAMLGSAGLYHAGKHRSTASAVVIVPRREAQQRSSLWVPAVLTQMSGTSHRRLCKWALHEALLAARYAD